MKLHRQLLLISLLLLSVPWAGCQYIRGIDASLRHTQQQSLIATTQAIATVLAREPTHIYPIQERLEALLNHSGEGQVTTDSRHQTVYGALNNQDVSQTLFFYNITTPVIIDGYGDEWDIDFQTLDNAGLISKPVAATSTLPDTAHPRIRYRAATDGDVLYLFIRIVDRDIVYHNPTTPTQDNGDRLVLVNGDATQYVLTTSAPGSIHARYLGNHRNYHKQNSITAVWQENADGYSIELSMPLTLAKKRLGFYVVDESTQGATSVFGTTASNTGSLPPWLVYQPRQLASAVGIFDLPGTRISVIDKQFWPLSVNGEITQTFASSHWLLRKIYRAVLSDSYQGLSRFTNHHYHTRREINNALISIADSQWYASPLDSTESLLSVAVPIVVNNQVIAVVLAEQSSDRFAALTDEAFNQLLLTSLAALGVTGLGLLGYASWLSWRIRKLNLATQQVLDDKGQLSDSFPSSNAFDEIGDLTRSYAALLDRIRNYTVYLQTLSRKLSHELRTPLAIVQSSLDNLEHCDLNSDAQTYQTRAKEGASRLGNILTAMSEATRVEQSIQQAEPEKINLAALLNSVGGAYRDLHSDHHIRLEGIKPHYCKDPTHETWVVPDLIVQMLDKLIDNATDFCPKQGNITIEYQLHDEVFVIAVSNDGELLPQSMLHQLFDNMVSVRESHSEQTHLGLGLYIVQLIVDYHRGTVSARNRDDGNGVVFEITLPKKPAEAGDTPPITDEYTSN